MFYQSRSGKLTCIDGHHPQAARAAFVKACAPYVAGTSAELENWEAFACRTAEVSQEIEEHSFSDALTTGDLGNALSIELLQGHTAPVSDHSLRLPRPLGRPQDMWLRAKEARKPLDLPLDVSDSEERRLYGARHIRRRSLLRMKD
jgi:hypothetical protein